MTAVTLRGSRWFVTGSAGACNPALDRHRHARPIPASASQSPAALLSPHPSITINRSLLALRADSSTITLRLNPHSDCGTAAAHPHPPPRFRALGLFGRRPPERMVRSSLPASENLHRSRHRLLPPVVRLM